MNATQYLTEALGEELGFTPEETLAISHLMDGYVKASLICAAAYGTPESGGSVSASDVTSEKLLNYIKQDLETMDQKQLKKTYKHIRKIIAGQE